MDCKIKCEELRQIRAKVESDLGLKNIVRKTPCTFEGECDGTCLACETEERALMNEIYELSKRGELGRTLVPPIPVSSRPISTSYDPGETRVKNPNIYVSTGLVMPPREIIEPSACDEMENKKGDEIVDDSKKEDNEKKGLFGRIFGKGKK